MSHRRLGLAAALAAALISLAIGVSSASAVDTAFSDNFDGTPDPHPFTIKNTNGDPADPAFNFWHIVTNPQTIQVKNPDINPNLVTLPDAGFLPSAHSGTKAGWFGQDDTGTFCGNDVDFADQFANEPKSGCDSNDVKSGDFISPAIDLSTGSPTSAALHFWSWFEIEATDANAFDLMQVDYSTDNGVTWTGAPVELNPSNNPAGSHDQSYSNNGLEQSPSWQEYFVDLSPAVGHAQVKVKFTFDSSDELYNGFRGWLVDDVSVNTPYDVPAPTINNVIACSGTADAPVTVIQGANYALGSTVILDGQEVTETAAPSSTRIEIPAVEPGNHSIVVKTPHGDQSAAFGFTAGNCAPPAAVVAAAPAPNSSFQLGAKPKQLSGFGVQFVMNVPEAGTGSVGGGIKAFPRRTARIQASVVTSAKKAKKCKKGQKKKGKKCIKKVAMTFGPASAQASGAGPLSITVLPGSAAKKYLKKGKSLKVPFTLTFQSALGGAPTSQTQNVTVKGKKPVKKCKKGQKRKGKKCVKK
jgi:hypothetical protein